MNYQNFCRWGIAGALFLLLQFKAVAQPILFGLGRAAAGRSFLAAEVEALEAATVARSEAVAFSAGPRFANRPFKSGLWAHEFGCGHPISKHVGKSRSYLSGRNIKKATSYDTLQSANTGTAMAFGENRQAIRQFLRSSNPGNTQLFFSRNASPSSLGYGYFREAGGLHFSRDLRNSTIRIKNLGNLRYRIVTSFPR